MEQLISLLEYTGLNLRVWKRGISTLLLAWGLLLAPLIARGQSQGQLDANALPLPPGDGSFVSLRNPGETTHPNTKARLSYLLRPLGMSRAGPTPAPTRHGILEGVILYQLCATFPLAAGFDASLGLGAHLYQWGEGLSDLTGEAGEIAGFAARDPRLELGWGMKTPSRIELRTHAAVLAPWGSSSEFASESKARVDIGVVVGRRHRRLSWALEADALFRKTVRTPAMVWGPQLRVAGAIRAHLGRLVFGPELFVSPVLGSQPAGTHVPLPAEALLVLAYERLSWSIRIGAGTGLPLFETRLEQKRVRGPTAPALRALVEFSLHWDKPRATSKAAPSQEQDDQR